MSDDLALRDVLKGLPYDVEVRIKARSGPAVYTDPAGLLLEWDSQKGIYLDDFELDEIQFPNGQREGLPASDPLDLLVADELDRMRVRDRARRQFALETAPPPELPEVLTLKERLARPQPPVSWRIEGWQPAGTRVLVAAQYKAGKTTLTGNLARCLVDSEPWLGVAQVNPVLTGKVTILDFEMSERLIDEWLSDQGITHDDRVMVLPLRGKATAFDILTDSTRREWADRLKDTEYLILDCLRPVLDALGLDEHREGGRFLTAFDALCDLAGIEDALVVHHMGHQGERSRGDSRFRDWPDVEWKLVREDHDDPSSPRFLSAFGRDVEQDEGQLVYDPATRHLTWQGGSRSSQAAREALTDVLDVLRGSDKPLTQRAVLRLTAESEHPKRAIIEALTLGQGSGLIHISEGPRGSKLHHHIEQCITAPHCAMARSVQSRTTAPVPIEDWRSSEAVGESLLKSELGAVEEPDSDLPEPW